MTLRTIKVVHTIVWAFFVLCIGAIPVASLRGEHEASAWFAGVVLVEVVVLALNRGRCPLTSLAARHSDDRRANFDIYLPLWLARHNQVVFGSLYVGGSAFALVRWCLAGGS